MRSPIGVPEKFARDRDQIGTAGSQNFLLINAGIPSVFMKAEDLGPSGTLKVGPAASESNGEWSIEKVVMSRSARVLLEGFVRVPGV